MCVTATGWKKNTHGAVVEAETEGSFMAYTVTVVCSATGSEVLLWLRVPYESISALRTSTLTVGV